MFSLFGRNKASRKSGSIAKDRLQLVLIGDRTSISPEMMEMIKGDIIKVISNYVAVDTSNMDFRVIRKKSQDGKGSVASLEADIPIVGPKRKV
jgi:cell division topological specificity factor